MRRKLIQSAANYTGVNSCALAVKSATFAAVLAASLAPGLAQDSVPARKPAAVPGMLTIPPSSQVNAEDRGRRAHTNVRFIMPATAGPLEAPPYSGYAYETPASLACIYRVVTPINGCNPNATTSMPHGGSHTIAIVDAYDDPSAASDLAYFSDQFGVPFSPEKFKVVYAAGFQPSEDPTGGWELEEAVDIEYSHAMAPHAMLYLVEANSNSFTDLFTAVEVATNLVQCGQTLGCPNTATGKGEVSISWGGSEFPQETEFDPILTGNNVVYVAATGDSSGVLYPSASPNVVAAGGTTTARSLISGNLIEEISWSDAGGGQSFYEPIPRYQFGIESFVGPTRATPDVSADSNPDTGVWVYNSFPYLGTNSPSNWLIVGGTSVAAPTITGILNAAATLSGKFAFSTKAELTAIYSDLAVPASYAADFNDIVYGGCNYYSGSFARHGFDFCTGVGSPRGLAGK